MDRHEAILDLWHTLCYLHPDVDPSAYVGGKVSWDWVCTTALHLPEDYPCHREDAIELVRICRDRGLLTGPPPGPSCMHVYRRACAKAGSVADPAETRRSYTTSTIAAASASAHMHRAMM